MASHRYVIVGAGSAGCTLANRLSEDPSHRVLLLEAGGSDRKLNIRIPVGFAKQFRTDLDWQYVSEPEPSLIGRSIFLPRGRSLGGSSSMNAMIYMRGHRSVFDAWASERGAPGWSYPEVLPYFKRSEGNEPPRRAVPQQRRAAQRRRPGLGLGPGRPLRRLRRTARRARHRRLQRRRAGGRGRRPGDPEARAALERRRRVPAPGAQGARQPRRGHRRAGQPDPVRGRPRGWGRVRPRRAARDGAGRGRGDPVRGRLQLPAAAHALGHRAGRGPPRRRGSSRGWTRPTSGGT